MTTRLRYLVTLFLSWTLFFALSRWVFLLYQFEQLSALTARDFLMISVLGLRMDCSMAGYFTLVSSLFLSLPVPASDKATAITFHTLNGIFLAASTLVIVTDLELYSHWGYRIDATPLMYVRPEGFASAGTGKLIVLVVLWLILTGAAGYGYWRFLSPAAPFENRKRSTNLPLIAFTALMIIPIRSGIGIAPLNTGFVYYHRTLAFPNHAGINPVWNFLRSVLYMDNLQYPENLLEKETANRTFGEMMVRADSSRVLIAGNRPNVLLIIMEGFTSKIIEPLGGMKNVAPELSRWCENGILFEDLYASGDRTDKGIISILSGYPAQPRTSIIKFPSKSRSLPSWPRVMERMGYHPTFVYGGDPRFANMESYLVTSGFRHITRDDDFSSDITRSKWGVHDEHLFSRLLSECDSAQGPFFKVALTLSSHEPFDVPFGKLQPGASDEALFLNSCRYSDRELGKFLDAASKTDWWNNTLVIITADHGHAYPGKQEVMDPGRFRIPMLWTGGAITDTARISVTGSQTDIVNTVLGQFSAGSNDFRFSKDLLARSTQGFAVYAYNNGYGYRSENGGYTFDLNVGQYHGVEPPAPEQALKGRSWMQMLFTDYNSR